MLDLEASPLDVLKQLGVAQRCKSLKESCLFGLGLSSFQVHYLHILDVHLDSALSHSEKIHEIGEGNLSHAFSNDDLSPLLRVYL